MSWALASFARCSALALAAGFAWYERIAPDVAGARARRDARRARGARAVAFAPLPNVKPTTDIVLLAGYALGGAPGFAVGAVAALASNLFFGQGPWTPWQMAAWGAGGRPRRRARRAPTRARASAASRSRSPAALAGLLFGAIMDFCTWVTFSGDAHARPATSRSSATSLPFNVAHAVGNVVFCLAFGPALVRALLRFRARFDGPLASPAGGRRRARRARSRSRRRCRGRAGRAARPPRRCLPAARAERATAASAARAGAALDAAAHGLGGARPGRGRAHPRDVARAAARRLPAAHAGRAARDPATSSARSSRSSPRALAAARGRRRPRRRRCAPRSAATGRSRGLVNRPRFARPGAARRAGGSARTAPSAAAALARPPAERRRRLQLRRPRRRRAAIDDTARRAPGARRPPPGAARARRAARRASSRATRTATAASPLQPGAPSNAQSTAWAVQALVAAGRDPARVRRGGSRTPLGYLRTLVGARRRGPLLAHERARRRSGSPRRR